MPSAEDIIKEMLKFLLDPKDSDRAFVPFNPSDNIVMLVNNFGGLSGLEFEGLVNVTLQQLKKDWNLTPTRIYAGILETSLNGQGFSITLGNMTGMSKSMGVSVEEVIGLLDAPTNAPAWPKNNYVQVTESKETAELREKAHKADAATSHTAGPCTPSNLISALRKACHAGLEAEPTITQYDLQMGDGDCGEAVAGVCQRILTNLDSLDENSLPPLIKLLESIGENVEDVGGMSNLVVVEDNLACFDLPYLRFD